MSDGRSELKKDYIKTNKKPFKDIAQEITQVIKPQTEKDYKGYTIGQLINTLPVKPESEVIADILREQVAIKHDSEKVEYHYISPVFLEELSKVLTFGAKKYAAHNWRAGFKYSRVFSALMRHLMAWLSGETYDKETGLNHLAHAACCIMFLLEFAVTHPELDDRYVISKQDEEVT